jgi:hypothetical protein
VLVDLVLERFVLLWLSPQSCGWWGRLIDAAWGRERFGAGYAVLVAEEA